LCSLTLTTQKVTAFHKVQLGRTTCISQAGTALGKKGHFFLVEQALNLLS